MPKEWRHMTHDERTLTVMLCFISSYAKIHAMRNGDIMPQLDEMARLTTWWNSISEDQKRDILEYIHKLPGELEMFQNSLMGVNDSVIRTS